MDNDPLNLGKYINCYKEPLGYYLDNNDFLYKKCFENCLSCEINGSNFIHNCLKCNQNFPVKVKVNNYLNCYENCSYYHYYDENHTYFCTINFTCPDEYPYLIKKEGECTKNVDILEMTQNLGKNDTLLDYFDHENLDIQNLGKNDTLLEYIEMYFTSEYYDTEKLDKGEEEIFTVEEIIITLTTSQIQKENINKNKTSINLEQCEIILKDAYDINRVLYI